MVGWGRLAATVLVLAGVSEVPHAGAIETPISCIPREDCCMICEKGKACGNACIAANKTCHKGRGCACNASEVCEE